MPPARTLAEQKRERVSRDLARNRAYVESVLGRDAGAAFDVNLKELVVAGRPGFLVAINGFVNAQVMALLLQLLARSRVEQRPISNDELARRYLAAVETEPETDLDRIIVKVLSGYTAIFVEGEDEAILVDVRAYPGRLPGEPELEKVLRGPRDGFTETLLHNVALIRRRLRDPSLRAEVLSVGERGRTDVAVVYIDGVANPRLVAEVRRRVQKVHVDGLPMAEKSLEEFITPRKKWWNPFPVVRYTERPDIAAVHLLEGHVLVLVDTSPVAIILPVSFFHHLQHAEEFHQDVIVGIFFRFMRFAALALAWFVTPVWVALAMSHDILPKSLAFIGPKKPAEVPLFLQFILGEAGIELIRMALIHTPSGLTTSMGIIGAVLLGEMAVKVGLFSPEAVLYVTLSALGFFAIPSHELAAAVRLMRLLLLVLAGLWRLPGVAAGLALNFILLLRTDSFGVPYLWPLLPFNARALWHVVLRQPVPAAARRPGLTNPGDASRR